MPGSLSPWPEVKIGSNGHPIQTLQYLLRARAQSVVVDGAFGPQTEAAVKALQASRGLAANGIVDPNTWAALVVEVKKGAPGRGGQRRARGVPVPQPVWRPQQGATSRRDLRTHHRRCGARFSAGAVARHSVGESGRNCWTDHLAGARERHALALAAASRRSRGAGHTSNEFTSLTGGAGLGGTGAEEGIQ